MTAVGQGKSSHAVVTGDDLRNVTFASSRGFGKGYDVAQVDAFVEECAALVELIEARYEGQIARLRLQADRPADDPTVTRSVDVLTAAQKAGESIVVRAQEVSEGLRAEALQLRAEARSKAENLIREANAHSESVVAKARFQIAAMEREAEARLRQAQRESERGKAEIESRTAYLVTLQDDIRLQMQGFLSSMLDRVANGYSPSERRVIDDVLAIEEINRAVRDLGAERSSNGQRQTKTAKRRSRRPSRVAGQASGAVGEQLLPSPRRST